jgi:archaellum biogenesis ATPase FlaH
MAGVKGRSGRRSLTAVPVDFDLPPLGDDEQSVMLHLEALSRSVRTAQIDPRIGDTLQKIAAAHLRAINSRGEVRRLIETVKKLSARLDEVQLAAKQRAVETREHARTGAGEEDAVYDDPV